MDKAGQTIDCSLVARWDAKAATRFLTKTIRRHGVPETITIDGSEANAAAIRSYNEEHRTAIAIRQVRYLNNVAEIVFTHMTKTRGLAAGMGGDGVADLAITIGHEDPINQELHQGPLLGKRGVGYTGLDPLAECVDGLHPLKPHDRLLGTPVRIHRRNLSGEGPFEKLDDGWGKSR
ncbi:MAG: DDE-type integrase/transposase/recombinase [Candidatus Entotheonellia bacterium]